MVHFFGILSPGPMVRSTAVEAPAKANFFGGMPETADGAALSLLEEDAIYLADKAPEPAARRSGNKRHNVPR